MNKMFKLGWLIVLTAWMVQSNWAIAGFLDGLFQKKPYITEKEMIEDLKVVLKYSSQCLYASCNYNTRWPFEPLAPCTAYGKTRKEYDERIGMTTRDLKTNHAQWYLDKIETNDYDFCD
jgi:hypothetical protein